MPSIDLPPRATFGYSCPRHSSLPQSFSPAIVFGVIRIVSTRSSYYNVIQGWQNALFNVLIINEIVNVCVYTPRAIGLFDFFVPNIFFLQT